MLTYEKFSNRYCSIILDKESQLKLVELTKHYYNDEWENYYSLNSKDKYCHHMSISYDSILEDLGLIEGKKICITIINIGISPKAIAVKVDKPINNMTILPHITIAVNRHNNGERLDSNNITDWKEIETIELTGYLSN